MDEIGHIDTLEKKHCFKCIVIPARQDDIEMSWLLILQYDVDVGLLLGALSPSEKSVRTVFK